MAESSVYPGKPRVSLQDWLEWIEDIHPLEMDFTLARARAVARRLGVMRPAARIVTVAGTNGKGSTVRCLEAALVAASVSVGAIASPHLFRFNERIRLNGVSATDEAIVRAFEAVEAARHETPLTYYEYGVLAAFWLMREQNVDVALLEVGLGGRLDTVNILDADVAVVTQIGIDHQAILGDSRETIGTEKAGIFRAHRLAVIGDPKPPRAMLEKAVQLQADLRLRGEHFHLAQTAGQLIFDRRGLPLRQTALSVDNVLTALAVLHYGFPETNLTAAYQAICTAALPGRLQLAGERLWLDVGHNPDCARHLMQELPGRLAGKRLYCLYATLNDKDASGFVSELDDLVAGWYLGATQGKRGLCAAALVQRLAGKNIKVMAVNENFETLFQIAMADMTSEDALLVCGSFSSVVRASKCL